MLNPTLVLSLMLAAAAPAPPSADLSATLAKLDAASAKFTSAQATFKKDEYIKLIGDHTISNGSVYFLRTGGATEAGIKVDGPGARIATYRKGILHDYTPKANCYSSFDSSANKGKTESFLTLGFGGSGKDLAAAWDITDQGTEIVEGIKAEKLELVSKDQGVRNNFSKVVLWMDLDRDVSVKQMFYAAGTGDTNTAVYSNIRLGGKVDTKPFEYKAGACK